MQNKRIQTLTNLGLSLPQAKIYLALAGMQEGTNPMIAKVANLARQEVYRQMPALLKMGLAEKIIAKTTMYRATPIKEGLSILMRNKKAEYIKTKRQVKTNFSNFNGNNFKKLSEDNSQFLITSERNLLFKMHEKKAIVTKKSIDVHIPAVIDEKMFFHDFPFLKKVIKRGVKIRIITNKITNQKSKSSEPSSETPFLEFRYLPETAMPFGMHIFDKQEMTISISEKMLPSLWTNSPIIVKLAEAYFENMWENALTN